MAIIAVRSFFCRAIKDEIPRFIITNVNYKNMKNILLLCSLISVALNLSAQITIYKYGNDDKMFMTYIVNGDKVICYDTLLLMDSVRLSNDTNIPLRNHYMVTCYDNKSKMQCNWVKYKDSGELSRFGSWHNIKNNSKTDFFIVSEQAIVKPMYKKQKGIHRVGEYDCKIMEETFGEEKYTIYYVDNPDLNGMLLYRYYDFKGLVIQITKGDKIVEQLLTVEPLNESNTIFSQKEVEDIFSNWKK